MRVAVAAVPLSVGVLDALHALLLSRRRRRRDLFALHLTDDEVREFDPRIMQGFGAPVDGPRPVDPRAGAVIALHLHYPELWPEFHALLQRQRGQFALLVSLTEPAAPLKGVIQAAFPGAECVVVANRGRDVGPFFELLSQGRFDGAEVICKIHGKRSVARSRLPDVGERWRRSALVALLGEGRFQEVVGAFRNDPLLGIVGPSHLLVPNDRLRVEHPMAWGRVKDEVEELGRRMGLEHPELEFFGGTMFWLSGKVLEPLRRLNLRQTDFVEAGSDLGTLAHACERIFAPAARSLGLSVATVPPKPGVPSIRPRPPDSNRGRRAPTR